MIHLTRPFVGEEELAEIKKVLDSKYLTEGSVTREFERLFKDYVGAKHALAMSSCSTALDVALRVVGVGPGDEIVAPDYTYPITAGCAWLVGAEPVLVDIDLKTYTIDMSCLLYTSPSPRD